MLKHRGSQSKNTQRKKQCIDSQDPDAAPSAPDRRLHPKDVEPPKCDRRAHVEDADDDDDDDVEPPKRNRCAHVEDADDDDDVVKIFESDNEATEKVRAKKKELMTPEEELSEMQKDWTATAYAFCKPEVTIETDKAGVRGHVFCCANHGCKMKVKRWLDKGDQMSTGNMRRHIRKCWGEEALAAADEMNTAADEMNTAADEMNTAADEMNTAADARPSIEKFRWSGDITVAFERKEKGKVTYSVCQHTRTETRAEIVRWVSESLRPFTIIEDHAYQSLMKTGQPEYWIPSCWTVARDVHKVFACCWAHVAKMLQEYDGELSFATDAWTSLNHKAIVTFTVHLQHKGMPLRMVLDVVEVADSHSGVNLATAFAKMVDDFKIAIKMLSITVDNVSPNNVMIDELAKLIKSFQGQANCARCFDHIINLMAKSLLRQFDIPQNGADATLDDTKNALHELAKDLELGVGEGGEKGEPPNDIEGLQDECEGMSMEDHAALDASVRPVKLILVKLRKIASVIIHSSTKLLPAWLKVLADLELAERKMPRDVITRWNSTFRMLEFALEYWLAVDEMTGDRAMEL
ncbi:putative AC transposase [Sparassis crispa]|uniref:Putative AC transposase n=1 Tax=Sparassis crispa TaxID=139825 RepID=A0A401GD69_9APHY|nr:putative AC transposase [Sparassis crispa]GBE80100.1 putative AC transposase [Sparassis crispa]